MSQENVEMVRRAYDAMNQGHWDAAFRDAHPDFEMTFRGGPNAGTHRGREAVQGVLEDFMGSFVDVVREAKRIVESGDQVVVRVVTRVRPHGSDAEIVSQQGHLWTIRDGKILSIKVFGHPADAFEAAGLSE